MKEGDVAGFSAFNGLSGVLAVVMENGKKQWVMSHQSVSLSDREKRVTAVEVRTGFQPFLLVGDQQQSASHNDPAVDENL